MVNELSAVSGRMGAGWAGPRGGALRGPGSAACGARAADVGGDSITAHAGPTGVAAGGGFWHDEYLLNGQDRPLPEGLRVADGRHRDGRRGVGVGAHTPNTRVVTDTSKVAIGPEGR